MYFYRTGILIITIFLNITCFCSNKIVYLISPPRSLSVAFLRMMQSRGDFSIMHEPSQLAYILSNDDKIAQSWYRPEALRSFDAAKRAIFQKAQTNNLFVKEMSFAVRDFHINDHELMQHQDVYFVFLVRDPHHAIISLYKMLADVFNSIPPDLMFNLVGYKTLYDIFKELKQHAINVPYIIRTEELYNNPIITIQKFCVHVGIEFKPESLHWDSLDENFDSHKEWHEAKHIDAVQHWHKNAIQSTSFGKPTQYEIDEQGNPTFNEIKNNDHRSICKKIYFEHLPYYDLLIGVN